ncbi:MAG TPA: ATP-dependent DNA helicase [Candidatus Dormibacteraeota bacterium]|jgi:DNA helicase-2/ATP-dependent DNA helicase PcrA|nr:ATP-dependent DNA helicase [Candidatus Dormibacteraeota bacterium]
MTELASPTTGLSDEQRAAAQAGPDGAFLIVAGPGSGKTLTMVERFRWLVSARGLAPEEVLAVTFTEAAATELRERLEVALERSLDDAWIGTFHGISSRLLRDHAYQVGMAREVQVLDDIGQRLLRERLAEELRGGAAPDLDRPFDALTPDDVRDLVRAGPLFALELKGRGILPDTFREEALRLHARDWVGTAETPPARAEREAIEVLHSVYQAYQERLHETDRLDFDDLILAVMRALRRVPAFRTWCHRQFRAILVDEFQDTNRIQLELIRRLASEGFGNVTAVGDAKQSIYGWRDAEIENIRSRFPGRPLPLTHNYRSHQEILDLATDFIRRDPDFREEPSLVATRGSGRRCVTVMMAPDARREARRVANEIRRQVDHGRALSDIAILATSVRQLPPEFEDELRLQGIPYVTTAGSGFFDREEVKDVLALLRLVADPMDDGALCRLLQGPLVRMGDGDMYRLASRRLVREDNRGLYRRRGMRLRDCLEGSREEAWPGLDPDLVARLEAAVAAVDRITAERDACSVGELLQRLLTETGYLRHSRLRALREGPRALRNLAKVEELGGRFEREQGLRRAADFVIYLDQVMNAAPLAEAEVEAPEAVRLLTIHAAKGLEFGAVFLVDVRAAGARDTQKLFFDPDSFGFLMKWWRSDRHPRYRQHQPGAGVVRLARQERRRVIYVALTRARDELFISATRDEAGPHEVDVEADDFFAEILQWALANPEAAAMVEAEQLELPGSFTPRVEVEQDPGTVERIAERLELLRRPGDPVTAAPPPTRLSFTHLHLLEVCPVRYRFQEVLRLPAPPDELRPKPARSSSGAAELGSAVHRALAIWHEQGGDIESLYDGPDSGRELLRSYTAHPLAQSPTLGVEVEFNLLLGDGIRIKGLVDRICTYEGRTTLVDYKTNARLDARLLEVYSRQLRLYGLASRRGLLPGDPEPRLLLFDLRGGDAIEVTPDPEGAERWALAAAGRIVAQDFSLGPEHGDRPCFLCAYRALCPDRR